MKADVGLARQVQRERQAFLGLVQAPPVHGRLGQALQGEGFAGGRSQVAVHVAPARQVVLGSVDVARQQFGLAPDGDAKRFAARRAQVARLVGQCLREGDHLWIGARAIEKALHHAELAVEHPHRQVRQLRRVAQVQPHGLCQFAARMGRRRMRPRRDDQGGGVARGQRQPPRLGRLRAADGRVDRPQRGSATVGQGLAQPAFVGAGRQPLQCLHPALGVALFDLRQRGLGAQVIGQWTAIGFGGRPKCSHRPRIAQGVERLGAQPQRQGVLAVVRQHGLQVAQRVAEGGQPQGGLRGLEQPGLGFAQAAPGEPVARHQRGRQVQPGQALGDLTVQFEAAMRRDAVHQGLSHEFMAEAVARVVHHQGTPRQSEVQHREGLRLARGGEGDRRGRIDAVAGQRQPAHEVQRSVGHVAQALRDGLGHTGGQARRRGLGAVQQFQGHEGVALGQRDDAVD